MNDNGLRVLDALEDDEEITADEIKKACQEEVTQTVVRWLVRKEFGLRTDRDGWSNAKDLKAKEFLPGEAKANMIPDIRPVDDYGTQASQDEKLALLADLKGELERINDHGFDSLPPIFLPWSHRPPPARI